ncbi:hypothetical protein MN869_02575 [Acinetobacter sp. NIPH1876]|uniref:hypothetical protein n=1 Tax=Acinetobacter sp. NIPH1876 TaxID=2924041 RepID=UPI001FAD24CD|nr:hypothetical protein [Acinetobacter sp. NIPH1876]MCJ0827348.1 hypothetical protein [Acinetobacter sp. NIPH1876]
MRSELFEETLKQHKDSLTKELQGIGKDKQVALGIWDIEQNESNYEFYFNAAWDYRQTEVEGLKQENILLENGQKSLFKQHVDLQNQFDAMVIEIEQLHLSGVIGCAKIIWCRSL